MPFKRPAEPIRNSFSNCSIGNGICGATTTDIQIRVVDIMDLHSGFDVPSTSLIISTRMGGFTQLPLATVSIVLLTLSTGPLLAGAVPLAVPLSHRLLSYWFWNILDVFSESSTWGIPWYTMVTSQVAWSSCCQLPLVISIICIWGMTPWAGCSLSSCFAGFLFAFGMVWE